MPKKRGPKTDVLEALLKRVDGLEAKLAGKHGHQDLAKTEVSAKSSRKERPTDDAGPAPKRVATETGTETTETTETSDRPPCEDEARKATDIAKFGMPSPNVCHTGHRVES